MFVRGADGKFTLTFHSPGVLTLDDSTTITFANQTSSDDFQPGDFGIFFTEAPARDYMGWVGNGDQQNYFGPSGQYQFDQDGNLRTLAGIGFGEPNKADILFGRLNSDAGDILAGRTGADQVYGRGGNDVLFAGYALDDYYELIRRAQTPEGNLAPKNHSDLLSGGDGDDWLLPDAGNDTGNNNVMAGGAGNDVIGGSFQNDFIEGDLDISLTFTALTAYYVVYPPMWSVRVVTGADGAITWVHSGANFIFAMPDISQQGDDII
jgi:hypothetical protein